ncbi:MAG: electron transfer flavoprotein-ubiquinone oxidoreductase [Burkholderiaceae bacterium]
MQRDAVDYDLVIVGGGPAGLAAAIRAKQLSQAMGTELSVCLVEKAAEIGGHILSGAVIDPRGLQELLPDWEKQGAPLKTRVTEDQFLFLSESGQTQVPSALLPSCFKNHGNYIASLSDLVKWLGQQAEALGVEIYPGFAAAELLYNAEGEVCGIATGNMGVGKDGRPTDQFQPGMELRARYTLFAEGSRGQLGRQLIERFNLDRYADPQSYGIGIKELWQVSPEQSKPGLVVHTAGWPLDNQTYGGSFLYHLNNQQVAIGLVVGLNYRNPWLSPFEEFQRLKSHPAIRKTLEGGKRIGYGARAITAGGLNSLPELIFPGGALIGCEAGFLNASRIKGSHAAIKTGMLAAEACVQALKQPDPPALISEYPKAFKASWLYEELYKARNFKPAMSKGLWLGTLLVGIDQTLFGGRAPWTLHNHKPDHAYLEPADQHSPITYPKPDGVLRFDRLSSVFLSNTNHEENQPAHLTLKDNTVPVALNLTRYAGPEARYCPAGVYEYLNDQGQPVVTPGDGARLRINAQNCVHCKTCDIKDPSQNIVWVSPEGGGGPNYAGM